MAPVASSEVRAGMSPGELAAWEAASRGDEGALVREFDDFLHWFDAEGLRSVEVDEANHRMLQEVVHEARRQGAAGYVDDNIATASDWGGHRAIARTSA
jgi:hypothetical protein